LEFDVAGKNSTVASPCVGMCDVFQGVCMGCFRDTHEVNDWHDMTDKKRLEVLADLERRRKEMEG